MIFTFLHYFIFSSATLIYGIGLNNATILCDSVENLKVNYIKIFSTILVSVLLSHVIIVFFLSPLGLNEIFPLVSLLIFMTVSVGFEILIRFFSKKVSSDFNFSFLMIVFVLSEAISTVEIIVILFACILSFYFLLLILYVVKSKLNILVLVNQKNKRNSKPFILITIALLILLLCAGDVSWISQLGIWGGTI